MSGNAFIKTNLYEVNSKKYRPPRNYGYTVTKGSKAVSIAPTVQLQVWNIDNTSGRDIHIMIDTGADLSMLTESTAKSLSIDCQPHRGEPPILLAGAGGNPIVGFLRWFIVYLGGVLQMVPVIVPVSLEDQYEDEEMPIGASPKFDILGRAGIFEHYLLCFDSQRLYAFRRRRHG